MSEKDTTDNHNINSLDRGQYKLYILALMQNDRSGIIKKSEAKKLLQSDTESCMQGQFFSQLPTMFHINEQLKIHPRAFVQLTAKEKKEILQVTEKLKNGTVLIKQIKNNEKREFRPVQDTLKKYRIVFDNQIIHELIYIAEKLHVKHLDDFLINKVAILANIQPFQINRLYSLFSSNYRQEHLIQLAIEFAKFDEVDNFTDFCAAGEFAVILLRNEAKKCNGLKSTSIKVKQQEIVNEFNQNEGKRNSYINEYNKLKDQCPCEGLTFTSPRAAATHFYKHGKEICEKENTIASVKTYVDLVSKLTQGKQPDVYWTQEGSHKRFIYHFPRNLSKYLIILQKNIFTKDTKILTFFVTE